MEHYLGRTYFIDSDHPSIMEKARSLTEAWPATLIFADIRNPPIPDNLRQVLKTNDFIYHCYNNLYIDGAWLKATCAFDSVMCEKLRLPVVRFDGMKDAIFPSVTPDGGPFITYLRHRGMYDDVPFDEIIREFESFYGEEVLAAVEKGPTSHVKSE